MGSLLSVTGLSHRRPLISSRDKTPHELPRPASSNTGSQNLSEEPESQESIATTQQPNSSSVHKQLEQDSFCPGDTPTQRAVDVVLGEEIPLTAQHLPGKEKVRAETEFRLMRDHSDGMLNPTIFQQIHLLFLELEVDLFATHLTFQLLYFYSWRSDPLTEATDAFLQDWRGYANPHGT